MNHTYVKAFPLIESGHHFLKERKWSKAILCLRQALEIAPDNVDAHALIAQAYKHQGLMEPARDSYQTAHELAPENHDNLYNLALFYQESKLFPQAEKYYIKLLSQKPEHADSLANLGRLYQDYNQIEQARYYYKQDLKLRPDDPDSHFNLAFILLLNGDYESGWQEYEWRFKRLAAKRTYPHTFTQPRWQGESLSGKTLLVHGEQGFGDNLQFIRYLPRIKESEAKIILETPRPLAPLMKMLPDIDELLIYNPEKPPEAEFDCYIPLLSLPGLYKTTLDTIPAPNPLLKAPEQLCAQWSSLLASPRKKVALIWGGHLQPDPARSCTAAEFRPLCELDGFDFYGLQTGTPAAETEALLNLPSFRQNLGFKVNSFADTAAIISKFDLVITIDTAMAHLAGAMGLKVWVLLPFAPDWRWFLERNDSPWYPSMRLFRQPKPGNWQKVISSVKKELEQLM